ncbi:MAG: pentapeptide repeat-containing protein [Hyphomonadaceae bacterium]|nr:pentapeptide repeat-containing protein [Hyphomonadaceae bacterium]
MLTQLRFAVFAAAALGAVSAGQASAFWPFGADARVDMAPAYGGVCEECDLSGRILTGARMTHSNFSRSDFSNAVLTRADASHSDFGGADFTQADLSRARLIDASCPHARFERARLQQADARGADFTRATFANADVTRMNLEDADLSGADLRRARGLTQAQLDQACGDRRTRLPHGLRVGSCG